MSDNVISSTTQDFLDVYDITNNMVLLKDGTVAVILQIGTMNFSLLAEQEQDAIIYTYGSLLNSLNFQIQINIQSSVKDASRYLRLLDEQANKASSRDKAERIKKYQNFVANLIHERNVLEKKFFVIIPTGVAEMGLYSPKNVLPGQTKFDIHSIEKTVLVEKASTILDPRRDHLISQFNRIGLSARQLNTQEIIQNFYVNYNPESIEGQEVTNSANYTTPLVRANMKSQQFASKVPETQASALQTSATTTSKPTTAPVQDNESTQQKKTPLDLGQQPIADATPAINSASNTTQHSTDFNLNEEIPNLQMEPPPSVNNLQPQEIPANQELSIKQAKQSPPPIAEL